MLLGRTSDGEIFALRDFCPHRGMPLRFGNFDGQTIECCYHGWCFNTDGTLGAAELVTICERFRVDVSDSLDARDGAP